MKKVLILINSSGGLYDFRNEFVQALLAKYQVYVSMPDDVKEKELAAEGCRIIKTAINRRGVNPLEDLKLYRTYSRMMREIKPDLVVTYTIKPNIYGGLAAGMRRIPYITTITGLGGAFDRKGVFLRLVITLYRTGMRKAKCVFFQNEENRSIFQGYGITAGRTRMVMGSGVNLERHHYEEYPAGEETHFLFVGRVMKERGILEYIEAAKALHSDRVFFDILGYCDEDYQDLLNALEQQGVVRQIGFHTEVHPYLAAASAIVVASFQCADRGSGYGQTGDSIQYQRLSGSVRGRPDRIRVYAGARAGADPGDGEVSCIVCGGARGHGPQRTGEDGEGI